MFANYSPLECSWLNQCDHAGVLLQNHSHRTILDFWVCDGSNARHYVRPIRTRPHPAAGMAASITSGFNTKEVDEVGRLCGDEEEMEDGSGGLTHRAELLWLQMRSASVDF